MRSKVLPTRLFRHDRDKGKCNTIFYGIFGPLTLEMDRKMLLGIKKRAEATRSSK
ncbi:hypothetical protein ACFLTB_01245 [Chloroflexota bacterium]